MGLSQGGHGWTDEAWSLHQVLAAVNIVCQYSSGRYAIILYSLWDLRTVQEAINDHEELRRLPLEVSQFIMIKARSLSLLVQRK